MRPAMECLESRILLAVGLGADFDGDLDVDVDDFVIFKQAFVAGHVDLSGFVPLKRDFGFDVRHQPIQPNPQVTKPGAVYTSFSHMPLVVEFDAADVKQQTLNDCYFIAPAAAMAEFQPDVLADVIIDVGDGTAWVSLYGWNGERVGMRIDYDLPTLDGEILYAPPSADGEVWGPMLQKAYACFRYGTCDYAAVEFGWPDSVFAALCDSGQTTEWIGSWTADELMSRLQSELAAGSAVTLVSKTYNVSPIIGNHVYAVMAVNEGEIIVYDPRGPEVTLTAERAIQAFRMVSVQERAA